MGEQWRKCNLSYRYSIDRGKESNWSQEYLIGGGCFRETKAMKEEGGESKGKCCKRQPMRETMALF